MHVEIQEFYPVRLPKKPQYKGTLHIYVIMKDIQFDLRGYHVYLKGKNIYIYPPTQMAFDEGEKVRYPVFSIFDQDTNEELKKLILKEGRKFLVSRIKK